MARKSRKQIQVAEHLPTEFPITVGYARLSVNNRVESHSIENQKKIIALWAEQHELPISGCLKSFPLIYNICYFSS